LLLHFSRLVLFLLSTENLEARMSEFSKQLVGEFMVFRVFADITEDNLPAFTQLMNESMAEITKARGLVIDMNGTFNWDLAFLRTLTPLSVPLRREMRKIYAIRVPKMSVKLLTEFGMDSAIKVAESMEAITGVAPKPMPKVDVKFLNPFISGAMQTLKIQCSTEVTPGRPGLKQPGEEIPVDIAGVLGIISPVFNGSIALCFPAATFLGVMGKMLGENFTEINQELEDGAGELLNIIFGHAKRELNELGYGIEKAIPTVVRGTDLKVKHLSSGPTMMIPFDSTAGKFHIEIGLGGIQEAG
jgi:chemotaxis protein CheX